MKDDHLELETIRRLSHTTEKILVSIERALPPGSSFLGWRVKGQRRRLEDARRAAAKLADELQIERFSQVVEEVVEPPPALKER
jgi:hypothetical protein